MFIIYSKPFENFRICKKTVASLKSLEPPTVTLLNLHNKKKHQNLVTKCIIFTCLVNSSIVPVDTSLNTFIRTKAELSGTKFMCSEGGCGACIVNVNAIHPVTKEIKSWAVNSVISFVFFFSKFKFELFTHIEFNSV